MGKSRALLASRTEVAFQSRAPYTLVVRFEWDEEKRMANLAKHGLDFADAGEIFLGPVLSDADTREDYGENRTIGLGFLRHLVVAVVFTEPAPDTIRVISLRKALSHERKRLEAYLRNRLG